MVVWLGPSPEVEPGAIADAAVVGLAATAGAAATIHLVVARRARAHGDRATRRPWLPLVPRDLGLAWATVVSYRRLREWGIPVGGLEERRVGDERTVSVAHGGRGLFIKKQKNKEKH